MGGLGNWAAGELQESKNMADNKGLLWVRGGRASGRARGGKAAQARNAKIQQGQ